jgi:hypothetical protein
MRQDIAQLLNGPLIAPKVIQTVGASLQKWQSNAVVSEVKTVE